MNWKDINAEKPNHMQECFIAYVFQNGASHFYGDAVYIAHGGNGFLDGAHFTNEGCYGMAVTHWMPIPELPKEKA